MPTSQPQTGEYQPVGIAIRSISPLLYLENSFSYGLSWLMHGSNQDLFLSKWKMSSWVVSSELSGNELMNLSVPKCTSIKTKCFRFYQKSRWVKNTSPTPAVRFLFLQNLNGFCLVCVVCCVFLPWWKFRSFWTQKENWNWKRSSVGWCLEDFRENVFFFGFHGVECILF